MSLWKLAGELERPKGSRSKSNRPLWQMKAVLGLSALATGIWKNPQLQSRVVKMLADPSAYIIDEIDGKGFASFLVMALRGRVFTHRRAGLSFLGARMIGKAHGLF